MVKIAAPVGTKSARFRTRLAAGDSISEACEAVGIGYAFGYGIAKRTPNPETGRPFSETAASRRGTKSVSVAGTSVTVRIVDPTGNYTGSVVVDMTTGKVTRTK